VEEEYKHPLQTTERSICFTYIWAHITALHSHNWSSWHSFRAH